MRAVDQWRGIEADLPEGWEEARLSFVVEQPAQAPAAAGVLGPLGPGRVGDEIRFVRPLFGQRRNAGARRTSSAAWTASGSGGRWRCATSPRPPSRPVEPEVEGERPSAPRPLRAHAPGRWFPSGMPSSRRSHPTGAISSAGSRSTPPTTSRRAALLGAPLNPARIPGESAVRFRVSDTKGYGVSPLMARRCFERMDGQGVTGRLEVLTELADTRTVATQGPVWRVAGQSV